LSAAAAAVAAETATTNHFPACYIFVGNCLSSLSYHQPTFQMPEGMNLYTKVVSAEMRISSPKFHFMLHVILLELNLHNPTAASVPTLSCTILMMLHYYLL
jgi:hypothetical protein